MHIEIPHGCGRTHYGYQSLAECTWPDVAYVIGDGAFALLARCDLFTVSLYETSAEARRRKRALDANGCGKTCEGQHSSSPSSETWIRCRPSTCRPRRAPWSG